MSNEQPTDYVADSSAPNQSTPVLLDRTGAHRAPVARRRWVTFAWAALATGLLVAIGTLGLFAYNGKLDVMGWLFPNGGSATPTPTVPPTIDAKMSVNVINGTPRAGLAAEAADKLHNAGWTISARSNSDETTVKKTMVFYAVPTYEGAARGVCQSLGNPCQVKFTSAFSTSGAPLTVVIGADYATNSAPTIAPTTTPTAN